MSVSIARRLFTATEYERLAKTGILTEDDRVELIAGEIITMSPIGSRHAACVKRLNAMLSHAVGDSAIVSVQDPIRLSGFSEPEPDIALLRPRSDFYASSHPTPKDVLLIIEIADTSLDYDRDVKMALYARAGIPEVWLWDLASETVMQCARPVNGVYQEVRQVERGESLTSRTLPDLAVSVDSIFD